VGVKKNELTSFSSDLDNRTLGLPPQSRFAIPLMTLLMLGLTARCQGDSP
jgi:hypothetical protein